MPRSGTICLTTSWAVLLLLGTVQLASAETSTATILAAIEKGSREHRSRIQSGRGAARVEFTRIYPGRERPKLPGGVVVLDEGGRVPTVPRPAGSAGPPGAERSFTIEHSRTIEFAFEDSKLRWDEKDVVVRRMGKSLSGAIAHRALIGDRLFEYFPQTQRASARPYRKMRVAGRQEFEPFDPLHYGVKFFGDSLAELVRDTAGRTSATVVDEGGRRLYRLTIAPIGRESRDRVLWIDPSRGYVVEKYRAVDPEGFASIVMRCTFTARKNNIWLPASVEHDTFDPRSKAQLTRRRITFSEFVPNEEIEEDLFTSDGLKKGLGELDTRDKATKRK